MEIRTFYIGGDPRLRRRLPCKKHRRRRPGKVRRRLWHRENNVDCLSDASLRLLFQ